MFKHACCCPRKKGTFSSGQKVNFNRLALNMSLILSPKPPLLMRHRDTGMIRTFVCGPMWTAVNQILLPRCSYTGELFCRKYAARKKLFCKIVFNEAIYFYTFQGSLGKLTGWYLSFILWVLSSTSLVLITNGQKETFPHCMKLPSLKLNYTEM